jgi:hydrogenase-4 component E
MSELLNLLLVVVLLFNFLMLGTSRVRAVIDAAAAQGTLLGVAYLAMHGASGMRALALGVAMVAIKGVLIPRILRDALRSQGIRREVEPFVSFTTSLLLGALATGLSVVTTRRKSLTQVVGYLTLENGIFMFGLTLIEAMPFLVEAGVLLDVLVGVFVMGIVVDHISREFSSIDGEELTELRE